MLMNLRTGKMRKKKLELKKKSLGQIVWISKLTNLSIMAITSTNFTFRTSSMYLIICLQTQVQRFPVFKVNNVLFPGLILC